MAIERHLFEEIVKDAYSAYYSIVPAEETGCAELPLLFRGDYSSRDEQYFFVKSANIWGNEKNEFAYVFSAETYEPDLAERCIAWALEDMLPRVKPHKEHQYTNCKVVLIGQTIPAETAKLVSKRKFSKSYGPFSTHGYTELLAASVDIGEEKTCTNRMGQDMTKFFGKLFALRHEEA